MTKAVEKELNNIRKVTNIEDRLTPMKAIRAKCLDCSCNQVEEVRHCPVKNCPIWPYRMGKNPYRNEMTSDQKKKLASNLRGSTGARKK